MSSAESGASGASAGNGVFQKLDGEKKRKGLLTLASDLLAMARRSLASAGG
jgi:hypothetical protein